LGVARALRCFDIRNRETMDNGRGTKCGMRSGLKVPVRERNGSAISVGGTVDMLNQELETHIGSIDGKVSSDHPLAHLRPASSHTFKVVFRNQKNREVITLSQNLSPRQIFWQLWG